MAGALGDASFYDTHVSPIHYLPVLFSYFWPFGWLSWYALVYALVFAALVIACYLLLARQTSKPVAIMLATIGTLLFFFSQSVFQGAWEMHMEFISPLLALLMFWHWQQRRYRLALLWLLLNAAVREDIAAINGLILALLAAAQWLQASVDYPVLARERLRWGLILVAVSLVYTVAAFAVQKLFFHPFVMDMLYFPKHDPFGHISLQLLASRASVIFSSRMGLWLPILVLIAGAAILRDAQLLAAPLGILPYWLLFFFAKFEGGAILDTYRPFVLVILLLWPALMALNESRASRRRHQYMWLQALVLISGMFYIDHDFFSIVKARLWPQPLAYSDQYQRFAEKLPLLRQLGTLRASHGVLALYPYQFPAWYLSDIADLKAAEAGSVDIFVWFENDRDQQLVDALLKQGKFDLDPVPGTRIHVAQRRIEYEP